MSFVCPLLEESTGSEQPLSSYHHHRVAPPSTNQMPAASWDVDSMKQLNSAERDMLARQEAAFGEKCALEAQIDEQSQRIRRIEAALERYNGPQTQQQQSPTSPTAPSLDSPSPSFDDDDDDVDDCSADASDSEDASSGSRRGHARLEHRLVRHEMQLAKYTESLATLADEMHGLEIDHYSLIVTRRKLENEALQLHRFHGLSFQGGLRTTSLMQLTMSTPLVSPVAPRPPPAMSTSTGATPPLPAKRLDRSASVVSFPRTDRQQKHQQTPTAIRITYDSCQSMEQSSDGGISSQGGDAMLDSSVNEAVEHPSATATTADLGDTNAAAAGDDDDDDQGCCTDLPVCCRMQALRHQIAFEKATLMKNLEVSGEKRLLDEGIDRLQELQRQYVAHEKRLAYDVASATCVWHRDQQQQLQQLEDGDSGGGSSGSGGVAGVAGGPAGGMVRSLLAGGEMQTSGRYASECTSRSNQSSCEYCMTLTGPRIGLKLWVYMRFQPTSPSTPSAYPGTCCAARAAERTTSTRSPSVWTQTSGRFCDDTADSGRCTWP